MKKTLILVALALMLTACEKDPDTGELLIIFEYDGTNQENVECTLYSSWENFVNYTFLEEQISDEFGEVYFSGLLPGWYYYEGVKEFSSMFSVYVMDSVKVEALQRSNKRSIMHSGN
jgi:hypothetical protein